MASRKKAPSQRIRRDEARDRLVQSTIDLLDSLAMNEMLVDVIAQHAGLASGHVLVHRYFGSRTGLLSAATHHLSDQLINALMMAVGGLKCTNPAPLTLFQVVGANVPLMRKRAMLVGELSLNGADPALHAEDMKKILDALESVFSLQGMSQRAARATALNMFTLVSVEATQSEWTGASQELRDDLRNLTLMELNYASEISRQLGWE